MKRYVWVILLLNLGLWVAIVGCDSDSDGVGLWDCYLYLSDDPDDCPMAILDCEDSPYYGPIPEDPESDGYLMVEAFGECTGYHSSSSRDGTEMRASSYGECISEEEMLETLCGE
jgi:hypothetical protein